jgi:hypothetical protein
VSGEYRFCCGGIVYSGVGTATRMGAIYQLQHFASDRRLFGRVVGPSSVGTAFLQSPPGVMRCNLTDRDVRNDTAICP